MADRVSRVAAEGRMMLGASASAHATVTTRDTVVEVIADVRAFHDLREQWNELLEATESSNPFLTWEWMRRVVGAR